MNSECKAAIRVKRTGESRSGHSSKSSDIHTGNSDDESFFFESENYVAANCEFIELIISDYSESLTTIFFPLCFLVVLALTPMTGRIMVGSTAF